MMPDGHDRVHCFFRDSACEFCMAFDPVTGICALLKMFDSISANQSAQSRVVNSVATVIEHTVPLLLRLVEVTDKVMPYVLKNWPAWPAHIRWKERPKDVRR